MRSFRELPILLLLAGGIGLALGMSNGAVAAAGKVRTVSAQSLSSELKPSRAQRPRHGKTVAKGELTIADLREKMILHHLML